MNSLDESHNDAATEGLIIEHAVAGGMEEEQRSRLCATGDYSNGGDAVDLEKGEAIHNICRLIQRLKGDDDVGYMVTYCVNCSFTHHSHSDPGRFDRSVHDGTRLEMVEGGAQGLAEGWEEDDEVPALLEAEKFRLIPDRPDRPPYYSQYGLALCLLSSFTAHHTSPRCHRPPPYLPLTPDDHVGATSSSSSSDAYVDDLDYCLTPTKRRPQALSDEDEPIVRSVSGSATTAEVAQPQRRRHKRPREGDDGEVIPASLEGTSVPAPGYVSAPVASAEPPSSDSPSPPADTDTLVEGVEPPTEKFGALAEKERKRPQARGASVHMNKARDHFDRIQDAVLASFDHKDRGKLCCCGAQGEKTIYRCVDCFKSPMNCQKCIVKLHEHTPFHRIESWNGLHFVRTSLHAAGMILHMCFNPVNGACPNTEKTPKRQVMTLGEENGFHEVEVEFCGCNVGQTSVDQLLAVKLLPSSFSIVKTVFTWTVMKQFHIHSLTSKKSAYDYIKALCKITDNASYLDVKDRYREFQFAYRIWRFLALKRRTGQAHGIDKFVPHRRPGSLTTGSTTQTNQRNTYTHYFCRRMETSSYRGKTSATIRTTWLLNAGAGYFVETEEYNRYVALAKPVEDPGTCSHLSAARMQNIAKFKNAVISGVVAVQCARHGFYLPQGMVDLTKGEAFAKTDYAIAYALGEATPQRWIMLTYDIWCQYSINLLARIANWFPSMLTIFEKIRGAIPKMHIHGHIALCQLLWNLNWLRYHLYDPHFATN
ncbi:hypothetical protein MSAN_02365200 [Mycena sanguinolenta]|uniref:CxC2-like cysteine cluster KDZ transposase-associated domain-containing protein n=1 Tax=Mycena sanguinolenta TaxID=230812 RepID=A0A8H6X699_9AGAR|nr:hypothetical protein MSAN_02365200 [Mycena sanguinolenta]